MKKFAWITLLLLLAPLQLFASARPASLPAALGYLSPSDGDQFVPPSSTIALRLDGALDPRTISAALFRITGSVSGQHPGQTRLADDGATLVFKPATPFQAGETVTVVVGKGLATRSGAVFDGLRFGFTISAGQPKLSAAQELQLNDYLPAPGSSVASPASPAVVATHPQDYVTFPHDFPAYTVTVPASGTAPGLLFMAPFTTAAGRNFLLIADDSGEPVYWQAANPFALDFKQQPDGSLTYFDNNGVFHVLDNTYSETRSIVAAGGFTADSHDLQILPNGDALFLVYDPETVDMTQFGGYTNTTVIGLRIQELDPSNNLVFSWDSWSHFAISDTYVSLTTTMVDYVHGNAIELDNDGNLLLSSRHLKEITKIDHTDGHIIWRLGGKNDQFAFTDPDGPFSCQHDIRRLANGDITIYDNHNPGPCAIVGTFSRAVEYQIDETAKVVTNTWQYRNSPDTFGFATGDNQRLPNGNRLIDWGITHPNVTEVLTDGTKAFELTFSPTYYTYRAFRFPWAAVPAWAPTLVLTNSLALTPTLYYSWNGATDVASYEIYGGFGAQPQTLLGTQPRTGFEDHSALVAGPPNFCAFRVRPVDHEAQPQQFSNVIYTRTPCNGFADLAVTTSANTGLAQPGQALTYTLVYTNAGPDLAPTVSLTDIVPANLVALTYTSSGAALTPVGPSPYAWQVADLAPGAGGVVTVTGVLSGGLRGSVFTNTATIAMVYSDTNSANNTSAVNVTVANVAPVAADNVYAFVGSTPFTVAQPGVLANDTDANNDELTAVLSTGPVTGTLALNADGAFTYTAPAVFSGPITFTYRASDGLLLSAPTVVTITVNPYQLLFPIAER